VFKVALSEMMNGIPLTEIKKHNRTLIKSRGYPEMPSDPRMWKDRWLIERRDSRSLQRQYSRISGINITEQPHINVDLWLDPNSPQYNKTLADAVFHYSARDSQEERFEICISTDEMKEAAWKYGYQSQIMLDGTFGICDKRVLLFIIMGVDGNRRGVPLAFLLFSAPSGNKHTAAGYDTAILAKLLKEWRSSLEAYRGGKSFYALVATTDTDLKERGALLIAILELLLLICCTHLRRSWKNHRMKVLKGKTPAIALVSTRLRSLEDALVKTTSIDAARSLIADEVLALEAMKAEEISEAAAHGGLEHLRYLSDYWLSTKDPNWIKPHQS
jgi:hypothetical protein